MRAHHVERGEQGEAIPVGLAVGGRIPRPGGAVATADEVRAHDEEPIGVDGPIRTDERLPPPRRLAVELPRDVTVGGHRVNDQHRVVPGGVQRAPGLVAHLNGGELTAVHGDEGSGKIERLDLPQGDGGRFPPAIAVLVHKRRRQLPNFSMIPFLSSPSTPCFSPTRLNASRARSNNGMSWSAESWVRMRAWPFGTTGKKNPMT